MNIVLLEWNEGFLNEGSQIYGKAVVIAIGYCL